MRVDSRSCRGTSPTRPQAGIALAWLLTLACVLAAQWLGHRHRIEHPAWAPSHASHGLHDTHADHPDPHPEPSHDCAAFDTAALSDAPGQPPAITVAAAAIAADCRSRQAAQRRAARPELPFASRAPPRA
jgi:hypothetical protein